MATYEENAEYLCAVTQQGFTESIAKKTPGFFLRVKPVGQVIPDDPENTYECPSQERQVTMWITEKTAERIIEDLRRLGFTGSAFADLDPEKGNFSFVGRNIRLVCKHETSADGTKTYDKFELPFFGKVVENDKTMASKLDRMFGKMLKEPVSAPKPQVTKPAAKAQAKPVPASVNAELQEGDGDSIPF